MMLAGVFGEELVLPKIPAALSSFAIMQRWRASNEELDRGGPGSFAFEIQAPSGQANRFPTQIPPMQRGVNVTTMSFVFKFANFPFLERGEYRFRTYVNNHELSSYKFYVLTPEDVAAARQMKPPIGFHPSQ